MYMHMYMYVCVCVCVCIYVSRYVCTCVCVCMAGGIEPAPSRHDPGDSTTDTAPTTTHYMHTATDGTGHKHPDRPSGRCCC